GRRFNAELHLLNVFEPPSPIAEVAGIPLIFPEPEIMSHLYRELDDVGQSHGVPVGRENIHVVKGRPFEEICRLASDKQIDLIVMPTHGHTGLRHLMVGSTTEQVVRHTSCPVLVLKRDVHAPKAKHGTSFRKIVVPIDFSPSSMKALDYAQQLAHELGST